MHIKTNRQVFTENILTSVIYLLEKHQLVQINGLITNHDRVSNPDPLTKCIIADRSSGQDSIGSHLKKRAESEEGDNMTGVHPGEIICVATHHSYMSIQQRWRNCGNQNVSGFGFVVSVDRKNTCRLAYCVN